MLSTIILAPTGGIAVRSAAAGVADAGCPTDAVGVASLSEPPQADSSTIEPVRATVASQVIRRIDVTPIVDVAPPYVIHVAGL
jgi:hypothetical protein